MNFIEMKKIIHEKIVKAIENNVKLYEEKEEDVRDYNIHLMLRQCIYRCNIQSEHPKDSIKDMQGIQNSVKDLMLYEIETEVYGECNDGYVSYCDIEYEIYELYPFKDISELDEQLSKRVFKVFLADEICEGKDIFGFTLDCKMLELFKDNIIDFETLKKISLSNCSL